MEDKAPLAIAIDLSQTMDAIDVSPTRLERAKLKVRDLLALRQGAKTAIVGYAGSAHLVLPLTDDATLIETYVDALATALMPTPGKDTTKALAVAEAALANAEAPGTILFITDGVEGRAFDAFKTTAAETRSDARDRNRGRWADQNCQRRISDGRRRPAHSHTAGHGQSSQAQVGDGRASDPRHP